MVSLEWSLKDFSPVIAIPNGLAAMSLPSYAKPTDSKSWGIPEFRKNLNDFPGIPVKIYKIWGHLWISSHTHWALLTGFPMSSMGGGGGGIFSGIAQCLTLVQYSNWWSLLMWHL